MAKHVFNKSTTLLKYPLTRKQYVICYYLVPYCFSSALYIINYTADTVLSYQHYDEGDSYHASLTLFWTFVPAIACFFLGVTNLELWPNEEKCGVLSWKWFGIRFIQHLLFPIWAMFRYFLFYILKSKEFFNCFHYYTDMQNYYSGP